MIKNVALSLLMLISSQFFIGCGESGDTLHENSFFQILSQSEIVEDNDRASMFKFQTKHDEVIKTESRLDELYGPPAGKPVIDFITDNMIAFHLPITPCSAFHLLQITEYTDFIAITSQENRRYQGPCPEMVTSNSAWITLPKSQKHIIFDEQYYVNNYRDENASHFLTPTTEMTFETLAKGYVELSNDNLGKRYEFITTQDRLSEAYATAGINEDDVTNVDFENESVIALYMGSVKSLNTYLEVESVFSNDMNWTEIPFVNVTNYITPLKCNDDNILIMPFQFIKVPIRPQEVVITDYTAHDYNNAVFQDTVVEVPCDPK